jgi:hypothetical protein
MTPETILADPYDAVLSDLRAKRTQIDNTIELLESLRTGKVTTPMEFGSADQPITETAGRYLGMSIVDAAKKALAAQKRTMGNVEIAKELQDGGLVLTSAEPVNVVGSVLTRRFNQVGDVVKVGRGIWGLKEWYPGRSFKPSVKVFISSHGSSPSVAQDAVEAVPTEAEKGQKELGTLGVHGLGRAAAARIEARELMDAQVQLGIKALG